MATGLDIKYHTVAVLLFDMTSQMNRNICEGFVYCMPDPKKHIQTLSIFFDLEFYRDNTELSITGKVKSWVNIV